MQFLESQIIYFQKHYLVLMLCMYSQSCNMDKSVPDGVSTDAAMNNHTLLLMEVTLNVKLKLFKSPHYEIPQKRQNCKLLSILLPKLPYSEDMKTSVAEVAKSFASSCSLVECQSWNNDYEQKGKLACPAFLKFIKNCSL